MSRAIVQRRTWLAAIAAMAALFAGVMTWGTASTASAEPNRRLCRYIDNVPTEVTIQKRGSGTDTYTVSANLYVLLNYKKDGKCPEVEDPYRIGGDGAKTVRLSYKHPEPKTQCEDWDRGLGVTGHYRGPINNADPDLGFSNPPGMVDVCQNDFLAKDTVYEFYVISGDVSFADGTEFKKGDFVTNRRSHV
ncbi:hypothetical protein [Frankia sp. Cr1]|uniref:hypothetical protein n=1 Tax=Frankia sp. Cr1 TaxID=3073931 RepID=UPI002AD45F2F|nr:hypothetical protein [Frankia sp. Cr1]